MTPEPATQEEPRSVIERHAPSWLVFGGVNAWLAIGIVLISAAVYLGIEATAVLVVPLVVAVVLGMLFSPLVEKMVVRRIPRWIAAVIVMSSLLAIVIFTCIITVEGVVSQVPEIQKQVQSAFSEISKALDNAGIVTNTTATSVESDTSTQTSELASAAFSNLGHIFSSVSAILFGFFILAFMLFYMLTDWHRIATWIGGRLGVPADVGIKIVNEATYSVRIYFGGLTVASIIVATIIGLTMWAFGLPLAFTVAVVTFVTAYIPYLGAFISGAFAFLVALGSGGITVAIIVLLVVLVSQNVIQAVVQTKLTSENLRVHPTVNFGSTILGAIVAGAIGAILAPPIVATMLHAQRVLSAYFRDRAAGELDAPAAD